MAPENQNKILKNTRAACISNAEAFLTVAERELGNSNTNHICYHLALLGMEEIGKSILATISFTTTVAGKEKPGLMDASDDHKKKIFWAIWGGSMLRDNKFTKEGIEQSKHLADTLHERRLGSLYTNARNPIPVDERIEDGEVKTLVELTRARLEIEKTQELTDFEVDDIKTLTWFFNAVEDEEKKKHIFGSVSLKKLNEVQNGKEWIKWLYDTFRKNAEGMRELAEKELKREEPQGEEEEKPKYLM